MPTLVCDIETIGEKWDDLDEMTQEMLTWNLAKENLDSDGYEKELQFLKEGLGFSPLTGEIVAIGVMDVGQDKGVVYYQAPGEKNEDIDCGKFILKQRNEKEMLEDFWQGMKKYDTFVGYNSRGFDVPFLMLRSAIHKIKPTKNLMSNRYVSSQIYNAKHIDLYDQLSFYGSFRRSMKLHLVCRAFGIKSPKVEGITGDDVAELFSTKKYLDIAKYNTRDLEATKGVYEYWQEYVNV